MNKNSKKGFTLIEILVVTSIIGLLASVVLVGLGGVRSQGRDAKRLADINQVRNALELFYAKNSAYPVLFCTSPTDTACWNNVKAALTGAGIGVTGIGNDPTVGQSYMYSSSGQSYTLGAKLEGRNAALNDDVDGSPNNIDCTGGTPETVYCVQF